ncbi:MAG: RES family NAD+ phosphorylase [Pseudomonadota bacterium]
MAATSLALPSTDFATAKLQIVECHPSKLVRVSRYATGEPHFGSTGGNRFDAPGAPSASEFGACYFGFDLTVAIAESVLHDEIPVGGYFQIAQTILESKYVISFDGYQLKLANLTGAALKRLGGHADLAGTCDYAITQRWSLAVFNHPAHVDGFVYMSRHVNTSKAVILFDRARPKIILTSSTRLIDVSGFALNAKRLGIVGI